MEGKNVFRAIITRPRIVALGAPKLRSGNFGPKHFRGQVPELGWRR